MALWTISCLVVLLGAVVPVQSDKHSLYYIYTALSKPVELPGIYKFNAMGLLDDRQIDYYNSKEQVKIPKQLWMKEKMPPDYWEKGTQSRKSKEQWFNVNVNILIDRMNHSNSDVHVLQWRHGCEVEKQGDEVKFSKGIDEYSYDGVNFLSFDDEHSRWIAPVVAARPTKDKWDNVPILNQYTKGYLEKECVDWLNQFRTYGDEELRKGSPPDVYIFARKFAKDKSKLELTCLATGFYPKDVTLVIRKYRTPLPEHEQTSTGVRPNHDGTFQLRKSVVINDALADYDCYVDHITLKEPVIKQWDHNICNPDPANPMIPIIGAVIGVVVLAGIIGVVVLMLKKRNAARKAENKANPDANCNAALLEAAVPENANANACLLKNKEDSSETLQSVNVSDEGSVDKTRPDSKTSSDSGQGSSGSESGGSAASSLEKVNESGQGSSGSESGGSAASSLEKVNESV